jgi:hypothetical protein
MKLLNWAAEKMKQLSDWHGRKKYGDIPRFNKVAPNVQPPNREQRKETRWRVGFMRTAHMRIGPPVLRGKRAERVARQCDPRNLLVLPKSKGVRR